MLAEAVTIVVANLNVAHAFDLMVKSFRKYHGNDVPLFCWDNGSVDGCAELGKKYATRYFEGNESHGVSIDNLCRMVETPFTLVMDNDVETLAPFLEDMIAECVFCVCPSQRFDLGTAEYMGFKTKGQPRIDPCCALFKTDKLKWLLEHTSFAFYVSPHQAKHYDTGSMLYHFATAQGLPIVQAAWLWQRIHHYGTLTWGLGSPEGSKEREVAEERYAKVKERLALLREEERLAKYGELAMSA